MLRGDMSLVGRRPLLVRYLDRYSPRQARARARPGPARPGLTGLAQVSGRNATTWSERLELDVRYVDTWTVGGDLRIMARTVAAVLRRTGISANDHATMTKFSGQADGQAPDT